MSENEAADQVQALQARIEAGDTAVIPELKDRFERTRDRILRRLLIRTISTLASTDQLRWISKLYKDPDQHVRLWALAAISRLEEYGFYPLLVHAYVFDGDARVRSACRRTLRRLSPTQFRRLLEQMEQSPKPWMKEAAQTAIRNLGGNLEETILPSASASMDVDMSELEGADLGPGDPSTPSARPGAPMPSLTTSGTPLQMPGPPPKGTPSTALAAPHAERKLGIAEAIARDGRDEEEPDKTFSRRDCPKCGERIMVEAVICRYCQGVFDQAGLQAILDRAKLRVVPLPVRSPSHRGSGLVIDAALSILATPLLGLGILYFLLKDGLKDGRSLGKRSYNLRVVDAKTGAPCSLLQSAQRNVLLLIPFVPLLDVILLSATGLRSGDQIAGTRVIFVDDPPATAPLAAATMALLSLMALATVAVVALAPG